MWFAEDWSSPERFIAKAALRLYQGKSQGLHIGRRLQLSRSLHTSNSFSLQALVNARFNTLDLRLTMFVEGT